MPRRPRIKLAGIPQHVVQRGINREPCFFAEEDYHSYLHWLEKAAADWHCALHAYVLMTNHVHLLVTPETETGIAKLMRSELDEEALSDIRLALSQGQPLGHGRFGDRICAAAGVRRTQRRPGRPADKPDQPGDTDTQSGFGF